MRVPDRAAIFQVRQNHQFKQYVKGAGVTVYIEVLFADLLSLHLATFLMFFFFILVKLRSSPIIVCICCKSTIAQKGSTAIVIKGVTDKHAITLNFVITLANDFYRCK